jgi:hypothetical protein
MADHDFERVDENGTGYVLRCRCGWRSTKHGSAEVVGQEWDRHRQESEQQAS